MRLIYNDSNKPILKTEKDDVTVEIAFAEKPASDSIKQTILDLLTTAYEKRIQIN